MRTPLVPAVQRLIPLAACRRMPWKNGGGETTEVAAFPEGAGLDAFDWRVSMARVAGDGPFSVFPGIDRTLAVLDGGGLRLSIQGRAPEDLTPGSPPLAFPADVPTSATLLDGPVTDLNVMTRRATTRHALDVARHPAGAVIPATTPWLLLLPIEAGAELITPSGPLRLGRRDTLLVTGGDEAAWTAVLGESARLAVVSIRPA